MPIDSTVGPLTNIDPDQMAMYENADLFSAGWMRGSPSSRYATASALIRSET